MSPQVNFGCSVLAYLWVWSSSYSCRVPNRGQSEMMETNGRLRTRTDQFKHLLSSLTEFLESVQVRSEVMLAGAVVHSKC